MKKKDIENLNEAIMQDGFDYAMTDYSDWSEIKDAEFKRFLKKFSVAREELMDYLIASGVDVNGY